MDWDSLAAIFRDHGCSRLFFKPLAPNDNSKNQIYMGGSFDVVNMLPFTEVKAEPRGDGHPPRFKAKLKLFWISERGSLHPAPAAQLILYPQYPEVRLSGFLRGCSEAPCGLLNSRAEGRVLVFGVGREGGVLAYVASADSPVSKLFFNNNVGQMERTGVFSLLHLEEAEKEGDLKSFLLGKLKHIHLKGWIDSKRLDPFSRVLECDSPNCGGYTLEAELGITPNGFAEPDYLGWEIKQFNVRSFDDIGSSTVTLMTPEPTGGIYVERGVDVFLDKYGYEDKRGRIGRTNFGGVYRVGVPRSSVGLRLTLRGYCGETGRITDPTGAVEMVAGMETVVMSWSFESLLLHWNRKHSRAVYVPSMCSTMPRRRYRYGHKVLLCEGTDFILLLKAMSSGKVYYDPAIKREPGPSGNRIKRRSQFRARSGSLPCLYKRSEEIDLRRWP